ncbi:MAG TPA: hypothetical protein VFG22_10525 [Polyangiales bacterium]|nr:hypothetical protein [Polyangiales bacterium]
MFISSGRGGYTRSGEQRASGRFLMLFCVKPGGELRVLVRHVRMRQCGHWMMANVTVKSAGAREAAESEPAYKSNYWRRRVFDGRFEIGLSGTYGCDGLPISADDYPGLWDQLHPVPAELTEACWKGGGHNSAGSEGPAMFEWAKSNAVELSRLRVSSGSADTSTGRDEAVTT